MPVVIIVGHWCREEGLPARCRGRVGPDGLRCGGCQQSVGDVGLDVLDCLAGGFDGIGQRRPSRVRRWLCAEELDLRARRARLGPPDEDQGAECALICTQP